MKQRTFLDLTPLLDVVLILLFAFMLNVNAASSETEAQLENETETSQSLRLQLDEKDNEIKKLQDELEHSQVKIAALEASLDDLQSAMTVEKETLTAITHQLTKWFGRQPLKKIANTKTIDKFLDEASVYEQLYKYDTLSKRYFFVDITLQTSNNQLSINDERTGIYITFDDVSNDDRKHLKMEQIKESIEKVLENREGGYTFVLMTLSEEGNVYRYAYNLVWDAIKEIEAKYGADKMFKTKYKSPKMTTSEAD
ncbi:hypothetical protein HZI73_06235 [Vallitalea pronyensis]|uniref:Uncharacterized protein n=1 Tax=Vallitalea pronyensis TaxID=1348613 RepID=A0A8J8SFQ1_9FIRM|nr:hypothetical protein [Vallitalea pronyensis]QUI21925.1 hypothetical protein HZI73_06235 [Vallitalea pronyensis]